MTPFGHRPVPRPLALATVLAVLFLTFLDTTVVTVALGDMQYTLGAGIIPLQWVVNAYALVFAALMLFAGSLGDRFGRKKLMVIGIAVFCAGSAVCALAPGVGWVIAGRAVMGVGAAACEPGTLSVLRHLYPNRASRARAIGAWAAVAGLALALGPVIGGLLVAAGSWRAIFWFNLALGARLLLAAAGLVPRSRDPRSGRVDIGGFVLGAGALTALIVAGISGENHGYGAPWIITLFVVGSLAAVGLILVERRAANPMIDLTYFTRREVLDPLFGAFAIYFGIFSIFFFTALYLGIVEGYGGLQMAGLFGPMAALIVAGSLAAGFWVGRVGPRAPMITGAVISAAGIVFTRLFITADPAFGMLTLSLAAAGAGFGIAVVPVTSAVLGRVPADRSGMAAGATNTARQLGAVIGVTVLGALLNTTLAHNLEATLSSYGLGGASEFIVSMLKTGGSAAAGIDFTNPSMVVAPFVGPAAGAFRDGLHLALLVAAGLILLSAVVTATGRRAELSRSGR